MFRQAETDECMNLDGTCDNTDHLHIGDYVNYKNPTDGTYTIRKDKSGMDVDQTYSLANNQLNWRVLGIDEETGGLKLIAESTMKLNKIDENDEYNLYLSGAEAYVYGPEEIDKTCEMYKNSYAVKARSVNIEDINQALGIETEDQIKQYNIYQITEGIVQYGESYCYENQYTPESWLNGKQVTTVSGKITGYGFMIGEEIEGKPIINMENTRAKSVLFGLVENQTAKAYWLASRGVITAQDENYAGFGLGYFLVADNFAIVGTGTDTFHSNGNEYEYCFEVRPVVILQSDITKKQISKVADKVESVWDS